MALDDNLRTAAEIKMQLWERQRMSDSKFTAEGNKDISVSDTPEELARKLYDDPDYFENNPRGYKNMTQAAHASGWHDTVCGDFNSVINVSGKKLLDAGCATGAYANAFKRLGADVYGVELSQHASKVAKDVLGEDKIHQGSIHDLSMFDDDTFDIYFTAEVIEHVPYTHHMAMLNEAKRVTKPGGVIYLQGVIGYKDYLDPDPNDDAGHIAVFPLGYWMDMADRIGIKYVGCNTEKHPTLVGSISNDFMITPSWNEYQWQFLLGSA